MDVHEKKFLKLISFFSLLAGGIISFIIISFEKEKRSSHLLVSPPPILREKTEPKWAQEVSEVYGRVRKVEENFLIVQTHEGLEVKVFLFQGTQIVGFIREKGEFFKRELNSSDIKEGDELNVLGRKKLDSEDEFLAERIIIVNFFRR